MLIRARLAGAQVEKDKKYQNILMNDCYSIVQYRETTLERVDFTLQLLKFVTEEKERRMFTIFFLSSFCQMLPPPF